MDGKARTYHAPAREAQARETRARILGAAYELFVGRGYAATIGQIARAAGVSRATVELAFGTKAALLDAVVDVALAGDDEPVPLLARDWAHELDERPVDGFLDGAAAAFAAGAGRIAPLLRALDEGGPRDPRLAELSARLGRQRIVMAEWVVSAVVSRGALAADLSHSDAVETVLVLIDPMLHRRLLVERRRSADQLAAWLSRSFRRLLLDAG